MAKNTFLSFSTTAGDNTDVGGIGILGSNAVSNFDNALRTLMAILRGDLDNGTVFVTKSAGYTAVAGDNNTFYEFTATATLALTAAATLAADWHMTVFANGGIVTIDPSGAETINGAASLVLANGDAAIIICTGSTFKAVVVTAAANMAAKYSVKTGNYTALDADTNTSIRFTSAATLSFDVSANLRTNWRIEVWNDSAGLVTIDPDSTDTINGATTLILQPRQKAEIFKTGATAFQASIFGDQLSGSQLQGYLYGLTLTTNASDAANDVDIAAGAAGSDATPFYLMQLASALTKRIDAAWAVGTNQGGLDTGSVTNATYYVWLIQRSDTLVTDALFSLSSTAPTMPANYDRKQLIGTVVRASSANMAPIRKGDSYVSAEQVITSGGGLTLVHGLGVAPKLIQAALICKIAEQGYAVGDVLEVNSALNTNSPTATSGLSICSNGTEIALRFGSYSSSFIHLNKSTGATTALTNANWRLIVRAWA